MNIIVHHLLFIQVSVIQQNWFKSSLDQSQINKTKNNKRLPFWVTSPPVSSFLPSFPSNHWPELFPISKSFPIQFPMHETDNDRFKRIINHNTFLPCNLSTFCLLLLKWDETTIGKEKLVIVSDLENCNPTFLVNKHFEKILSEKNDRRSKIQPARLKRKEAQIIPISWICKRNQLIVKIPTRCCPTIEIYN